MKVDTRVFGEIDIEDEKSIFFEQGIIGFPNLQKFALIYNSEKEKKGAISWLQSLDEPTFALPVMDPLTMCPDYNPRVEDELLKPLGELTEDNLFVLVTVTVPQNIEEISINLKAPIVINSATRRAGQVIVEDDYPVKYKIYDKIKEAKGKAGE